MNNIAFIVTKSEIGGAQSWTNEMMKLIKNDASIHLITSEHGWLTEQGNFDKVFILPELKKHFSFLGYIRLLKYIRKEKISVMIASSANAGIFSRMAKLFVRFKCIYVSHGWSCIYNGGTLKSLFIKIEKYLSVLTDAVWCVSKSDSDKARDIIGINENKIINLTNSVPKMQSRIKQSNEKKIIFVGRLTHPKRPDLLLSVVAKHPDIKLDVAGAGDRLAALAAKYEKFNNIKFLGEVKNFSNYSEYDVFALISDSEGLPMSALEAHTAGLPLLLSDVGGCYEVIKKNGLLVSNNEKDIEEKLLEILNNYEVYLVNAQQDKEKFEFNSYKDAYKQFILS
ncbi:glycosyltransferase family 4 protein [Enterobacter sp. Ap-916]|uniref:glycosyltransferase n=1 Tax=unclassified Enterobacter TaxID=2608935 RepID=UPI00141DF34B|nr:MULTISPECIES: glycosyltransferase [unclassified Enterobacter]NIF57278.1 glycosyltransferase family 4 protein [Enterobacter sp. Ap-867]NIG28781.1 glycosyltransferase family 4 protein [Enterobacter sp. Ap-916]